MPVGEVELKEEQEIKEFKMKTGQHQDSEGQDIESLIMMYAHDHHVCLKTLTQTHLVLNQKY